MPYKEITLAFCFLALVALCFSTFYIIINNTGKTDSQKTFSCPNGYILTKQSYRLPRMMCEVGVLPTVEE